MISIRVILDPETPPGIGPPFTTPEGREKLVHLTNEIIVSGLPDGMQSGKPSMMFGFVLPDGTPVIAETSWALFETAYRAFAAKFGESA
jgi:hypothetical protein